MDLQQEYPILQKVLYKNVFFIIILLLYFAFIHKMHYILRIESCFSHNTKYDLSKHQNNYTHPLKTPRTRLRTKNEPMIMRLMKQIQGHSLPTASFTCNIECIVYYNLSFICNITFHIFFLSILSLHFMFLTVGLTMVRIRQSVCQC